MELIKTYTEPTDIVIMTNQCMFEKPWHKGTFRDPISPEITEISVTDDYCMVCFAVGDKVVKILI